MFRSRRLLYDLAHFVGRRLKRRSFQYAGYFAVPIIFCRFYRRNTQLQQKKEKILLLYHNSPAFCGSCRDLHPQSDLLDGVSARIPLLKI